MTLIRNNSIPPIYERKFSRLEMKFALNHRPQHPQLHCVHSEKSSHVQALQISATMGTYLFPQMAEGDRNKTHMSNETAHTLHQWTSSPIKLQMQQHTVLMCCHGMGQMDCLTCHSLGYCHPAPLTLADSQEILEAMQYDLTMCVCWAHGAQQAHGSQHLAAG